ncbi:MAG: hypothetical protein MZU91_02790 [Desulfosudis oleivorans]|nr:hypothetical protein [Desulfosudis oleivorans]
MRPSNTQPVIVLRFEARDREAPDGHRGGHQGPALRRSSRDLESGGVASSRVLPAGNVLHGLALCDNAMMIGLLLRCRYEVLSMRRGGRVLLCWRLVSLIMIVPSRVPAGQGDVRAGTGSSITVRSAPTKPRRPLARCKHQ